MLDQSSRLQEKVWKRPTFSCTFMWRYLITIVFAAALAFAFHFLAQLNIAYAVIVLLICAPLMARLCAPIFVDMASRFIGFARRSAYEPLQGNYYSFDGRRVRFFVTNETIWVAETDVAGILAQAVTDRERRKLYKGYGVVPGRKLRGFTEDGRKRPFRMFGACPLQVPEHDRPEPGRQTITVTPVERIL